MTVSPNTQQAGAASHGIIGKFLHLASAQTIRDILHTCFFIYLARMDQSHYGEFQLAFNTAMIVLFLGEFGLNQPLVSSLSKKFGHKGDILVQYTLIKGIILLIGWFGVWMFVLQQRYTGGLTNLIQVITAGVGLEALASSFFVACRVQGRQDLEARIKSVGAIVGYGWALGTLALGFQPHWIALFKLIENGINLIGGAWFTISKTDVQSLTLKSNALARTWNTAKGGVVFVFMAFFSILYNKANLFFLQKFSGPHAVAQYSATWEVVDAVQIPISSLLMKSVLFPLFVGLWRQDKNEFDRLKDNSVKWLFGASIPVMFFLFVESDRIIGLIYGASYVDAMWLQKWLVPSVMFSFIHNLAAYLMMSQHRQYALFWIYGAGLAFNILLCALLIPNNPLLGAGLSIVITKGTVACCTTFYCQRSMKLIKWRAVRPVLVAALIGAGLYLGLGLFGIREVAETGGIAPFVVLGWTWWKDMKAQARVREQAF
ncbi:MAG: oligosaccharide flippase family protein [Desulfovibrio sp.]|nr:oligosaccharide flippase family protein [Desulfovibrio sp.]MBI4959139.1 oligosaccharide flippase family protein [Desulfovibrio sp.]